MRTLPLIGLFVTLSLFASDIGHCRASNPEPDRPTLAKTKKRKKLKKQPDTASLPASTTQHHPTPRTASPIPAPAAVNVQLALQRHTLSNGVRVVLHPEPALPSVAVSLALDVGPATESPGASGFAQAVIHHLVTALDGDESSSRLGPATLSASSDFVQFTTLVPPSHTQLALWREARRVVQSIDVRAHGAIRSALERSDRVRARVRVAQLAYQGCWPYQHRAFGWTADLAASNASSLEAFRRLVVSPKRMVVSVTGQFDSSMVLERIRLLFEPLPIGAALPTPILAVPDQINQREDIEKSAQAIPQYFVYGWAVPEAAHPDLPAIQLAIAMLRDRVRGERLTRSHRFRKLTSKARLRIQLERRRGPSLLTLRVDFPATEDMDRTRKVIDDAMLELSMEGPTAEEMNAAWTDTQVDWLAELSTVDTRAARLASSELLLGNASNESRFVSAVIANNREEVRRAVMRYLTPIRRNLFEKRGPAVLPPAKAREGNGPTRSRGKPDKRSSKRRGAK